MIRLYFTFGTILLAAFAAVLIWSEPLSPSRAQPAERFTLTASEEGSSVILEWNPKSAVVRTATGGLLAFEDGGSSHLDKVDVRVLRQGSLEYRRRSPDVLLRLSLFRNQDVIGHASVRLTGAAVPVVGAPPLTR